MFVILLNPSIVENKTINTQQNIVVLLKQSDINCPSIITIKK